MQPASQPNSVVRFGVFEADLRSGELRKDGVKIKIQDLPFRALRLLLSHPNEVLSRDQFRRHLWPDDVFVDFDHGISSAINRLRDALGDSAENPIFIETVERRGYRWIAPIHTSLPAAPQRPVLVKTPEPVAEPAAVPKPAEPVPAHHWAWSLAIPAIALGLAVWSFHPFRAPARAASSSPTTIPPVSPAARQRSHKEAEEFYLKGRFYWDKRTPEDLNLALDAFTQAIVRDPNYAKAYVGLADCYNLMREYTLMPATEAYSRALAAAQRAVELDDQSSEAHASLAFALFYGTWNAPDAEREFRRAIQLDSNNAVAHHWYATFLSVLGRHSEALAEITRAQALLPTSKAILADRGNLLLAAGQRDAALTQLKQLEAAEPDFVSPHRYLKSAYFSSQDYPNYLLEWHKEAVLMRDKTTLKIVEHAEKGYASGGYNGMLKAMKADQTHLFEQGKFSPFLLARTSALLGDNASALRYLQTAYDQHDELLVGIENDSDFARLRGDPAFAAFLSKLNFHQQVARK